MSLLELEDEVQDDLKEKYGNEDYKIFFALQANDEEVWISEKAEWITPSRNFGFVTTGCDPLCFL